MSAPVAPTAGPLPPGLLAGLSPADQQAYIKNMQNNPAIQAALAKQAQMAAQQDFMRNSPVYHVSCPVQGGGFSATYAQGGVLVFEMPTVPGGYARAIKIRYDITATLAAGSSATYQKNAAAPHNATQEVMVTLGNSQIKTNPYVTKTLGQLNRPSGAQYGVVNAGQDQSSLDAQLFNSLPVSGGSANEWIFETRLPLNPIADDDVRGLIPLSGVGNQPTITLTLPSNFYGVDPLQNCVSALGGSGNALTSVTGTVKVEIEVIDGKVMSDVGQRTLDLTGQSTMQWLKEPEQQNLLSGALYRAKINTILRHWYLFVIVIDGQSSTKFCDFTNIQVIELSRDQTGNNNFYKYGGDANTTVYDYFGYKRFRQQQDLDHGVLALVAAPQAGVNDPANRSGTQYLNMMDGGYPAATYAIQVGTATSSNSINPRLVGFTISENPQGLQRS